MNQGPAEQATPLRDSASQATTLPQTLAHEYAPATALPPFSEIADPATTALRWRSWVGRLSDYYQATREKDKAVQRSLLLHFGGVELYKLFQHLPDRGNETDFEAPVTMFDKYFDPQPSRDHE